MRDELPFSYLIVGNFEDHDPSCYQESRPDVFQPGLPKRFPFDSILPLSGLPKRFPFDSILPLSAGLSSLRGKMMKQRVVVLFPTPGAGHLAAMIELAEQILQHAHNLSITILIIRPPSSSPFSSSTISQRQDAVAASGLDINFMELHQQPGVPEAEGRASHLAFIDHQKPAVSEALAELQQNATIPAFIVDMFCIASTTASLDLGIPTFVFFASGATTLCLFMYLPEIDRKYEQDLKDVTEELQFPGSPPLPSSAAPSAFREKKERGYQWVLRNAHLYSALDGILVNTFNEMQRMAIDALTDGLCCPGGRTPPIYPVGPLLDLGTVGSESDDHECIKWLDQQPHSSVLFLCFGSMGAFPKDQIHEIARALELSGHRFLWSLRVRPSEPGPCLPQPRDANVDEVLPAGFVERTRKHGLVWPKWVPQVAILSHPAVGGFVSHCGWNSTLESMWFGVPMIVWPLYAEQGMNAFELVNVLGVGLALNKEGGDGSSGTVRAPELERVVRSLMEDDVEGTKVREKMKEMKELGRKAVEEGGSSYLHLASLVERWTIG